MGQVVKFAVPAENGQMADHFGHCDKFAIFNIEDNRITGEEYLQAPQHRPGIYPAFLASQGVNAVIAGRMGQRAADLFRDLDIKVYTGVTSKTPRQLVSDYLEGRLEPSGEICSHHS